MASTDISNNQVTDISGNIERVKLFKERQKKQIEYLSNLVMRQTDYDKETAIEKLKEYKGDIMAIIREYMGPSKKPEENNPKTTNQVIMKEIRTLMDDAASKYRIKKDLEEKRKLMIERLMNKQKEARKKLQDEVQDEQNNQRDNVIIDRESENNVNN